MAIEYKRIDEDILASMSELWGEWIKDLITIRDDTFPLAAMDGDTPTGYVCVMPRTLDHPLEHIKDAYIESLGVHDDYRRQGIGQHLIFYAERWARSEGFVQIRSHSNVIAVEAINMWHKLGYGLCPHVYSKEEGCAGYYVAKVL